MVAETVALAIRSHQTAVATDWQYAELVRELHRWVELFDVEFRLQLPTYPVLKFMALRNAYATYASDRTELGTKDNIVFNVRELRRPKALTLRTLCHGLCHLWQRYHGAPARGRYHNKQFRDKALECGLVVDQQGCTCGHNERFTSVLAKHGVHLEVAEGHAGFEADVALYAAAIHELKMKKWSCGCTTVRCATVLRAACDACGRRFERAAPRILK